MKTPSLSNKDISRKWYIIDAQGKPLGRIASKIATILQGKHKPEYTPHIDNGDFVVVINAGKFILSGRKIQTKTYYHYSGYPSGLKKTAVKDMIARKPLFPLEKAVRGMLPKNRLAKKMIRKLYLYEGTQHKHTNVKLVPLEI